MDTAEQNCGSRKIYPVAAMLTLLCLLWSIICTSELFRAVFCFWYGPAIFFAALSVIALVFKMKSTVLYPAIVCTGLSPFVTWYLRVASDQPLFVWNMIALSGAVCWLLQALNISLKEHVYSVTDSVLWNRLCKANIKAVIYLIIIPMCIEYAWMFILKIDRKPPLVTFASCWNTQPPGRGVVRMIVILVSLLVSCGTSLYFCFRRSDKCQQY